MRPGDPVDTFWEGRASPLKKSALTWPAVVAILAFATLVLSGGRYNAVQSAARAFSTFGRSDSSTSPYATAADFTNYVTKLAQEGVLNARPIVQSPGNFRTVWKRNIVTTVFWVGEPAGPNNPVSNERSSWDLNWIANYGGIDPPETFNRRNYIPISFIPLQNPFYVALPYNDVTYGEFKPEAPLVIPWFKQGYVGRGQSVCKDHWIAIRKGSRICYAQWEDCGPFRTDHFQYVFGTERPSPNANAGAGLDVSPAIRDYLGLQSMDVTDWQFVATDDVPPGPWRGYGDNNPFVIARRKADVQLAKAQQAGIDDAKSAPVDGMRLR